MENLQLNNVCSKKTVYLPSESDQVSLECDELLTLHSKGCGWLDSRETVRIHGRMDVLEIPNTAKTPQISLNPNGHLLIAGRSIPENSIEFYRSTMEWLVEYARQPQPVTEVEMHFEYFNTSSSKCILDIFKHLAKIHEMPGKEVKVKWFFFQEDEDMFESGNDYSTIVKIPFEFIASEEGA